MKKFKNFLNQINFIYMITIYIFLLLCLVFFKTKSYEFNISSLIGIWKGFAELNPTLIEKGFIVYNDGGYDGQFFYLISKSLFINGFDTFPILDSFYLRFNRLGLSLLSGTITSVFGFKYYPYTTLSLLTVFHIYSFFLLHKLLSYKNKYLSYFYLFSPFALNSNLLLVADSLFTSFVIISIYIMNFRGVNFFNTNFTENKQTYKILKSFFTFLILIFICLIRESGIIILVSFFIICIYQKDFKNTILIFVAGLSYFVLITIFKLTFKAYLGTNPLGFLDLIDYPLAGFYNSIQFNSFTDAKNILRELAKFPIFMFFLLLILNIKNIKNIKDFILYIPVFFILFTAGVGEVGYWLSFDNISRMFTLSIVWLILLKNKEEQYNDYYALLLSFFILILLVIRIMYIKSPMLYMIY